MEFFQEIKRSFSSPYYSYVITSTYRLSFPMVSHKKKL